MALQLVAFAIGYAVLVAVSAKGRGAVAAIASLIAVYSIYAVFFHGVESLTGSLLALGEWSDIRVFIYIFLSLLLAGILKETGRLDMLVESISSIGCRFSFGAVPAIIGLLPMPGGALVSAVAMKRKYIEESRLPPEWATYMNHWFRHVWVPAWPLFQSIIITSAILEVDPSEIVIRTWPASIAAILGGTIVAIPILLKYTCPAGGRGGLVQAIWPFILLAVLVFGAKLPLLYALVATLLLTTMVVRPSVDNIKGATKFASKPVVHAILFEALFLKELLLATDAPNALYEAASSSGLPVVLVTYLVPFVLGLSAGGENFFAATAMPLLKTYLVGPAGIESDLLLVAYTGGFLGVMISPVHLCIVLTLDYFRANMAKTVGLVAAATVATTLIVLAVTLLL